MDNKHEETSKNTEIVICRTLREIVQESITKELKEALHKYLIDHNDHIDDPGYDFVDRAHRESLEHRYGSDRVAEMLDTIRRSDLPELSNKFKELHQRFNKYYFESLGDDREVEVRYAITRPILPDGPIDEVIWADEPIRILAASESLMVTKLLHKMARISASFQCVQYEKEVVRLYNAGAPVYVPYLLKDLPAEKFVDSYSAGDYRRKAVF
jgi:hypothetical protein